MESNFDVILIGYGPVGEALALALGRPGHRIAVIERWKERHPLPRAVCIDHEIYRNLANLGLGHGLASISHGGPVYRIFNAEWKELLSIDWTQESISGGPKTHFVHQPTLEALLDTRIKELASVKLLLGWEATELTEREGDVGDPAATPSIRSIPGNRCCGMAAAAPHR